MFTLLDLGGVPGRGRQRCLQLRLAGAVTRVTSDVEQGSSTHACLSMLAGTSGQTQSAASLYWTLLASVTTGQDMI